MPSTPSTVPARHLRAALLLGPLMLAGCQSWWPSAPAAPTAATPSAPAAAPMGQGPVRPLQRHLMWLLTEQHELLKVDATAPDTVLQRARVQGLATNESLVGMDYRVARGVLYALSDRGRLFTLDPASGQLTPVGAAAIPWALHGARFGVDFNPAADRVRVVSQTGQNLRLHPDTGQMVDGDATAAGLQPDPPLSYAPGDRAAGTTPQVNAAAYTYNLKNEKLTTNYAIDLGHGSLVTQGSHEDAKPPVSPNTGRLFTVGSLGVAGLKDAHFDIADQDNAAFAALRTDATRLYRLDLATGKASLVGPLAGGVALRGLALEP
jgi:hypothetical protein